MKPCDHCNVTQYQLDLAAKRERDPATYHEENCPMKRSPYTPMPWAEQPASEPHNGEELGADAAVTLGPDAQRLVTVAELATRWTTIKELPSDLGALWPTWEVKAPDGTPYRMTFGVEATKRVIRGASAARPLYLPGMNSKGEISTEDMAVKYFEKVKEWQYWGVMDAMRGRPGWVSFTYEPPDMIDVGWGSKWRPAIFAEQDTEPGCNCDHARDMESQRDYWKMRCAAADKATDGATFAEPGTRLAEITEAVDLMYGRLYTKQGTVADAMCRLSYKMSRDLLAHIDEQRSLLDHWKMRCDAADKACKQAQEERREVERQREILSSGWSKEQAEHLETEASYGTVLEALDETQNACSAALRRNDKLQAEVDRLHDLLDAANERHERTQQALHDFVVTMRAIEK